MTITVDHLIAIMSILFGGGTGIVIVLKHKGLVTFGKAPERRKDFILCDGHQAMHADIRRLGKELHELKKTLDGINLQLAQHMGYHEGKRNEN